MREGVEDIEIRLLLEALFHHYHYDFRHYARASIKRRLIQAREQMGFASLSALQDGVLHDPAMLPRLLDYLTVQVSEMFRDPSYFRALREKVLPHLRTYPSLKVWVAGCSHGEELYSLAILFREEGLDQRTQFYATDINPTALRAAEAGVYPLDQVRKFTQNHQKAGGRSSLSNYYTADYGRAVFDKTLRRHTVFSDHSLVTDAVFGEMHLISCRNVLIYFDRGLQDRAIGLFHDALARKGFLGLGSKESLRFSQHAAGFSDFDRDEKIFQEARAMRRAPIKAVAIGASAGGVQALSQILPALPADYPLPVIVVVHVPPDRGNALVPLFQNKCRLTVKEAEDKEPALGGVVYFAPSDYHLLVEADGSLSLSSEELVNHSRPAIDLLFESAADAFGAALAGIVLTGANEDGARGLRAVAKAGGLAIVENPDDAFAPAMPEAALRLSASAQVMTLDAITSCLLNSGNDMTSDADPINFLLVDDLEENLLALEALLQRDGLVCLKASTGEEALELLLTQDIALALLDVQMPGMDGFQLAEFMRGTERSRHIPIIFVTAGSADAKRRFRGYEAGAVDFIQKPIEADVLRSKANVFFDLHRQNRQITAQRDELAAYANALRTMDRHKNDFLAVLGHELRNPVMALSAGLHLLKRHDDPEKGLEIRKQMDRQVAHLERLVEDLLDISRIDQGKIALRREKVALQTILAFAVEASRPQVEAHQHTLSIDILEGPTWLDADPTRLAQVVGNLLGNAAKYTPAGGQIALTARLVDGFAEIDVIDNGIGIADEMRSKIFELFAQVKSPTTRAQEGLGIGLALVKQLVEMHGGSTSLESSGLNQGSCFRVRLPTVD